MKKLLSLISIALMAFWPMVSYGKISGYANVTEPDPDSEYLIEVAGGVTQNIKQSDLDAYYQALITGNIPDASEIEVDASGFSGNLSTTDTDVQTALEALDALVTEITTASPVGSTAFTDLHDGGSYSSYGDINDDTINELFLAIDTAISGLGGGHDPVTVGTDSTGILDLNGQEITLDVTPSTGYATLVQTEDALQVKYDSTLTEKSITGLGVTTPVTAANIGAISDNLDDTDASIEWEDASALDSLGALDAAATVGDTAFTDLNAGDSYTNYGSASDDTINELYAAVDTAIGGKMDITATPSDINVPGVGTPDYDNLQDLINTISNTKIEDGSTIDIIDNGDGTLTVSAGNCTLKTSDSATADTIFVKWAEDTNVTLTDESNNWVYVDYNSGSPVIASTDDFTTLSFNTNLLICICRRDGTSLHFFDAGANFQNAAHKDSLRFFELQGTTRASGLQMSETGDLNLAVTAGAFWAAYTRGTIDAFDSSGTDTFTYYYRDGASGWTTVSGQTDIDNLHYDDGTGTLALIGNNQYAVFWAWRFPEGDIYLVYGQSSYLLAGATTAQPPSSLPGELEPGGISIFLGKIIVQMTQTSAFDLVQAPWDYSFTGTTASTHNNLAGLQGGTTDEYYHLTSDAATDAEAYSDIADGLIGMVGSVATDVDTLEELNTAIADATLLDDGAIGSSTATGMTTGDNYTNYGTVDDDSINELFAAIDSALSTFAPTNVTVVDAGDEDATFYIAMIDGTTGSQAVETDAAITYNPSENALLIGQPAGTGALGLNGVILDSTEFGYVDSITAYIGGTVLNAGDEAELKVAINAEAGVDFQAFDADLSTYAGITPSANAQTLLGETFAQMMLHWAANNLTLDAVTWDLSAGTVTLPPIYDELNAYVAPRTLSTAEGADDTSTDAAFLTDSGESWTADEYIGMTLYNITDGSSCVVTDNDSTTMTCTLAGGTDNDWDSGDTWAVAPGPAQSGTVFYITSATTLLWPSTKGYSGCVYSLVAGVVTVDPQAAGMTINLNEGTSITDPGAGDEIDSAGEAGNFIWIHNVSTTEAYTQGKAGTWVDGGAS